MNYFHCDQIGIPREMTDSQGKVIWWGHYDAWGGLHYDRHLAQQNQGHQPFRLQNQYFDEETGLHYNFLRYYEPMTGRFTTQDPIGLAGGENFYRFADNVQGWIDISGAAAQLAAGCAAGSWGGPIGCAVGTGVSGLLSLFAIGATSSLLTSDTCSKCEEERRRKCKEATVENIKDVTKNTPYYTLQTRVSIPIIGRYTKLIEQGSLAPEVKMDGNTIVDGNHRMIAGLLCDKIPPTTPSTAPISKERKPLKDLILDPIDWGYY
ncbi:RHS domain-containing protein [Rodentibacter heylii]|nr:RHS domain-containing protein [Rodentibacter heylii]